MAEGRERSAEEREAARIERERRRAERTGRGVSEPAAAQVAPDDEAEFARDEPDDEAESARDVTDDEPGFGHDVPDDESALGHDVPDDAPVLGHEEPTDEPVLGHDAPDDAPVLGHDEPDDEHGLGRVEPDDGTVSEHGEPGDELDYETDEHEVPSGTRRVSHFEKVATKPKGKRRRPKPVRRAPHGPKKKHSWWVRGASLLALVLAGALIWFLVELFQPFHGSPQGRVTLVIPAHASSSQIGDQLARVGVVSSGFFFNLRATLAGERGDLRAGLYHLQHGMSYSAALDALTKAPRAARVTELTITEGRSRREVNDLLRSEHVRGSYLAASRTSPLLHPDHYGLKHPPKTLEGFLFPDTYQLVKPVKMSALVSDQLRAFKRHFSKVGMAYARSRHLTPYDVLTIASLIEGEAATKHDRPLVASVIYNRLADGMALQLDSTTRFATGNYSKPLTVSQLHSSSPYNTRTHTGLPPGPINSPGMAALQAAAHPAHTHYLFFFTKPCSHNAVFASTYAQFLAQGSQNQNQHCSH
ncbi:MAG TPA: endolytic transglycosylase MltG [Solirubrobacteraceae bacterium]